MIDLLDLMYEEFDIRISEMNGIEMLTFNNKVGDHTSDNSLNAEQKMPMVLHYGIINVVNKAH